ncbi:MAG: hypothetical protein WD467_03340 [Candidatus Saccharimonadales bacterium]
MVANQQKGKQLITLNEHIGVPVEKLEELGILNAIIGIDTKLFIDPKLINVTDIPELDNVVEDIRAYVRKLISVNNQAAKSERIRQIAIKMIAIEEPKGLSIGYGNSRDSGTSISESVARKSLQSLSEMISIGVEDLEVMEMLGLFISRFGADSISDLISHIIYPRLCAYTQRVSKELGIKVKVFEINEAKYNLPAHPKKDTPLIFVPLVILSELPLATSWEEIAVAAQLNEKCRQAFNDLVGADIANYAKKIKKNPALVTGSIEAMKTLIAIYDEAVVRPYDRQKDPAGYVRLSKFAAQLNDKLQSPNTVIKNTNEMVEFIDGQVIDQFRRNIEKLGANTLLYHRKGESPDYLKPVREDAAQIIFHTAADHICQNNDILVSREPAVGNGAVDFTIGQGSSNKAVVEIKKSNNKNLIDGYNLQLQEYVEREKAAIAFYVVVLVTQASVDNKDSQLNELKKMYASKLRKKEQCPRLVIINGLEQLSPSKMRSN